MRGGEALGCIALYRREIKLFDDRHVDLVETFAAQAVIAIENVRQFRELQTRLEREAATREILQVISRSRDDETPVFDVILANAARLCSAPFACLFLCNAERTHLEVAAYNGSRSKFVDLINSNPLPMDPEQSLTVQAIVAKRPLQIEDARADPIYRTNQPHRVHAVEVEGVRTLLTVPLMSGDEALGVIFLYRREVQPFDDGDVELVKTFAAQAVIAIENVRQYKALEARTAEVRAQADELQALNTGLESRVATQVDQLERLGRLRRFLSPQVADAVVSSGGDKLLGSHRALIAILFCDIRGFTAFCETAEPEETIEILQTYHEEMGRLINGHGAGVDHRSGDGIMVIFNDPLPCEDPAGVALRLALAMRDRMAELGAEWRKLGHRLGFGVGISLGYATVGVVGSAGRYDYTASGTAVNLASRLCDQASDGEILLSPRAYRAIEDTVIVEPAGALTLKGIQAPVEVVRVIRLKNAEVPTDVA
jgi:class 3 adenylate cyclase